MEFKDILKSSIRDKADVDAEAKQRRKDELSKRASAIITTAKSCLLNEAKNGNHTTVD